jgi:hypothetical protein
VGASADSEKGRTEDESERRVHRRGVGGADHHRICRLEVELVIGELGPVAKNRAGELDAVRPRKESADDV